MPIVSTMGPRDTAVPPMLTEGGEPGGEALGATLLVSFSYSAVAGSSCNSYSTTCSATSSSPACLQLHETTLSTEVQCSNQPQNLTVSSTASSLDIVYAVRRCSHAP